MSEIYTALRVSPFWLGAGVLLAFLALWTGRGAADEVAIRREVAVQGGDLVGQLARPIAEMKQELTNLGCSEFSVAYWSVDTLTRFRVEVRCRSWTGGVPPDSGGPMGRANHESTVAGQSR